MKLSRMKFRLPRRIKYLRKARHWRGHGIHSPFLFYLVSKVIENKKQYPVYETIRYQKKQLSNRIKEIENLPEITYKGIPVFRFSGKKKLFKNTELGYRYGKLLIRLINEFKPSSVFYYGPTFGLNLLYPALAEGSIPVKVFLGDPLIDDLCRDTLKNIPVTINFLAEEELNSQVQEFTIVNLPFLPAETQRIIHNKLDLNGEDEVMIIRGIHKSEAMETVWREAINERKVRVSLDLYEIGILLFRKKLQKQHFVLRF